MMPNGPRDSGEHFPREEGFLLCELRAVACDLLVDLSGDVNPLYRLERGPNPIYATPVAGAFAVYH